MMYSKPAVTQRQLRVESGGHHQRADHGLPELRSELSSARIIPERGRGRRKRLRFVPERGRAEKNRLRFFPERSRGGKNRLRFFVFRRGKRCGPVRVSTGRGRVKIWSPASCPDPGNEASRRISNVRKTRERSRILPRIVQTRIDPPRRRAGFRRDPIIDEGRRGQGKGVRFI
jgi:hypothetical protein